MQHKALPFPSCTWTDQTVQRLFSLHDKQSKAWTCRACSFKTYFSWVSIPSNLAYNIWNYFYMPSVQLCTFNFKPAGPTFWRQLKSQESFWNKKARIQGHLMSLWPIPWQNTIMNLPQKETADFYLRKYVQAYYHTPSISCSSSNSCLIIIKANSSTETLSMILTKLKATDLAL